MSSEILAEVYRGNIVESRHRGWIVVSDHSGKIIHQVGNPDQIIYSRSILKPFQILPHFLSHAFTKQQTSSQELAIMCSSHSAQAKHTQLVQQILKKISLNISNLQCGSHPPIHEKTYHQIIKDTIELTAIHNNCSGKHAGMLSTTVNNSWDIHSYLEYDHPIQAYIRQCVETVTEYPESEMLFGIDGCSAPNYALPIKSLALAYAHLANPMKQSPPYQLALKQIREAMKKHPFLVGGQARLDSELMSNFPNLVAKVGAQGSLGVSLLDKGLGIVMKIEDGQKRARSSIILEILQQLGVDISSNMTFKTTWYQPKILNHNQQEVGQIKVAFKLK